MKKKRMTKEEIEAAAQKLADSYGGELSAPIDIFYEKVYGSDWEFIRSLYIEILKTRKASEKKLSKKAIQNAPKEMKKPVDEPSIVGIDLTLSDDAIATRLLELYKAPQILASKSWLLSEYFGFARFKKIEKIVNKKARITAPVSEEKEHPHSVKKQKHLRWSQIVRKVSKGKKTLQSKNISYASTPYVDDTRFDHDD